MTAPEAEVERLYQLPLDQFTPTRDALARELRGSGERPAAEEVKRLRRPSVPAWGLNRLCRSHKKLVDELLTAGGRLRDAQQQLLAGGDRGLLRDAVAEERRVVGELVELAWRELEEAGHPVNATIQNRLRETLHAAAGNEEARELLAAGRLVHDYQINDLGLSLGAAPVSARTRKRTRDSDTSRKAEAVHKRLEKARAKHQRLKASTADAEQAAKDAQQGLAKALSTAERAEAAAARETQRLEEALASVEKLEQELADWRGRARADSVRT